MYVSDLFQLGEEEQAAKGAGRKGRGRGRRQRGGPVPEVNPEAVMPDIMAEEAPAANRRNQQSSEELPQVVAEGGDYRYVLLPENPEALTGFGQTATTPPAGQPAAGQPAGQRTGGQRGGFPMMPALIGALVGAAIAGGVCYMMWKKPKA